jgi:hypothetical protein
MTERDYAGRHVFKGEERPLRIIRPVNSVAVTGHALTYACLSTEVHYETFLFKLALKSEWTTG